MDTILVGKNGRIEHVPAHGLIDALKDCLFALAKDGEPSNIVAGLSYVALITDRMGPPLTIVKNPYEG